MVLPSERLRQLREAKHSSQKAFCAHAERAGYIIALRRYGAIERGDASPSADEIIKICRAMEISADCWLMGECGATGTAKLDGAELDLVRDLMLRLIAFSR